jgi:EAL domain-containing protein (putative c-di-GMP-specific phosphodiesterase class I)
VLYPSASAGISLFPADGGDPVTLIKNAETALFKTKLRDKGAHTWYVPSMGNEAKDYLDMQVALHRAIEQGELSVHYQPMLQTASGAICSVEALVRWRDKDMNWVLPSEFIPVAEMYGLMDRLGEWVLRTACRELVRLETDTGIGGINLAVNLSPKQLQVPDLSGHIMGILRAEGFPAERLQLELTENVLMYNPAECVRILESLRAQGITFAVDDFGTGYSSLGYLKRFPISEIKVDKSFVDDMDNRFTLAIIKAIVALGLSLGMEVTAEGVENAQQMEALGRLGCTQLQGYLIAKPMDYLTLCDFLLRRDSAR